MALQAMPPLTATALPESGRSGVSWGAVLAGTVVATTVTIMLTALGTAIGLGAVSPWTASSMLSAKGFTVYAAIWLVVVQWVASGFGGYLTGRLRTKWTELHTHEVFFRDTANGFVTWALSTLVVVLLLGVAGAQMARDGASVAGHAAQGASQRMAPSDPGALLMDGLLRPTQAGQIAPQDVRGEATRILFANADGSVTPEDRGYLAQMIASHTGLSQADAERRVDDAVAKDQAMIDHAKQAANAARKATSAFMLYSFISMLVGAFIACITAALGGQERDTY